MDATGSTATSTTHDSFEFATQMFQSECEYKGTHPFQERYLVIDAHLKMIRIYKNEQELRSKDNSNHNKKKYKEISLDPETSEISSTLHTVNEKPNCIKIIAEYPRYFHFAEESIARSALQFLQQTTASKHQSKVNNPIYHNPISMQYFQFQCIYLCADKLIEFMMVIDIKKGLLMLCSLKDGYNKLDLKMKNAEIVPLEKNKLALNVMDHALVQKKPNLTVSVKDKLHTFWFYDVNAYRSAVMCIQRIQKPTSKVNKVSAVSKHKRKVDEEDGVDRKEKEDEIATAALGNDGKENVESVNAAIGHLKI